MTDPLCHLICRYAQLSAWSQSTEVPCFQLKILLHALQCQIEIHVCCLIPRNGDTAALTLISQCHSVHSCPGVTLLTTLSLLFMEHQSLQTPQVRAIRP